MPTVHAPVELTVENLLTAVRQLSPAELRRFAREFAELSRHDGKHAKQEETLIETTRMRLPPTEGRRLKRLTAKCERRTLTPDESEEYKVLAQKAERINVKRVEALVKLTKRRGKPMEAVMREIGWQSGADAT